MHALTNLLSLFIGAGLVQGFFLAIVLLFRKEGNIRANRILAVLLATFSINIAHAAVIREFFQPSHLRGTILFEPFQLLFGPLVYLYIRELASSQGLLRWKDLIHFLPFALLISTVAPHLAASPANPLATSSVAHIALWAGILVHLICYTGASVHRVVIHDRAMRFEYSSTLRGEMKWIRAFLFLFILLSLLYFVLLAWMIHGNGFPQTPKVIALMLSIAVYGLGFGGLLRTPAVVHLSEPLPGPEPPPELVLETPDERSPKAERPGPDPNASTQVLLRVTEYTEREKPYLDPELTLPALAERLGMPRNQLSQLLNESLGKNFYDFINGYRVKEFQRLARDPGMAHLKILSLALDAGFNSKPTFNLVFKKTTGLTPSEYRSMTTEEVLLDPSGRPKDEMGPKR